MPEFRIAVLPGDGIGQEVMEPCLSLLETVTRAHAVSLRLDHQDAGAKVYLKTGEALPRSVLRAVEAADAILLGAMGLPEVRYPDGTEIVPQIDLREHLGLYAGVRPVRVIPGSAIPLGDPRARQIDFVLVRESTEGLFSARRASQREGKDAVLDTMRITRATCERLFHFAFKLARSRRQRGYPGRLTCVDKANVLPSMAFFRGIFQEIAASYPEIETDYAYVDATGLRMLRSPWQFDVLVTENMFGDILSDVGAGLIGGMGMAPSADIGDKHAVFQPCHGTAPDIAGRGLANPTAMFLSAAMMLEWLGERHSAEAATKAGQSLRQAVDAAFLNGDLLPIENGGNAGTAEITGRVRRCLEQQLTAEVRG